MYTPDSWVVVKFDGPDPHYRVLAGWSGGYLHGDSWKMNSGITKVTDDAEYLIFDGYSGSQYRVHKDMYGLRMMTASIWAELEGLHKELVSLMPEDTDWNEIDLGSIAQWLEQQTHNL